MFDIEEDIEIKKLENFYYKDWFIFTLSLLWFFWLIPTILAIILLIQRKKVYKNIYEKYINTDQYKENIKNIELEISNKKEKLTNTINALNSEIKNLSKQKKDLDKEITLFQQVITEKHYQFSEYENIDSEECKNKLSILTLEEQEKLKNNELCTIHKNHSSTFDKKIMNNNIKQIIRLFNSEYHSAIANITSKNISSIRNKITRSFETINNLFKTNNIEIKKEWLEIKLQQLNLLYTYELKKQQEKEQQKAIKEQMIEEEKVRREIEKQKAKIEKDQKQCNQEISKLIKYLQKSSSDTEKELYIDKIKELEQKIKELEEQSEKVNERQENAKAGFVYVISNIGSFGEHVYKIGMTRRLEPMDRIKELSSASVPFEFDVHAMIFSNDAPSLENKLHQEFKSKSVNQVNFRKEFFNVSLDEIEKVVIENFNNTVEFVKVPVAKEYRQTQEFLRELVTN